MSLILEHGLPIGMVVMACGLLLILWDVLREMSD